MIKYCTFITSPFRRRYKAGIVDLIQRLSKSKVQYSSLSENFIFVRKTESEQRNDFLSFQLIAWVICKLTIPETISTQVPRFRSTSYFN